MWPFVGSGNKRKQHDQNTPQGLIAFVRERYEQGKKLRKQYEGQMYLNMAFYSGRQWVYWDSTRHRIESAKLPEWRETLTTNLITPFIEQLVAKEVKNRPLWDCQPATGDEADINSARMCTRFLEYIWRELHMDDLYLRTKLWKRIAGKVFWKVVWDPTAGELVSAETDMGSVNFNLGQVAVELCDWRKIVADPACEHVADAEWVGYETIRTVDWVADHYGVMVPVEDVSSDDALRDDQRIVGDDNEQKELDHHCKVLEYWERPSSKYPNGRLVVIATDQVLYAGSIPYEDYKLPFVEFKDIIIPGRFWAQGSVEHMIPLQTALNKLDSQVEEIKKLMGKPRFLAPENSMITQPTSKPGEVLQYRYMGAEPRPVQPPPIPAYYNTHRQNLIEALQTIAGIREISWGEAPSGVRSGVALNILAERDDTRLGPKSQLDEQALAEAGAMILARVKQYYVEPRQLRVVGEDNEVEVVDFIGSNIRNVDVEVVAGSSLPQSKAAKQAFIMDLAQAQILNPQNPDEKRKILRYLEMGISEELFSEVQLDIKRAKSENRRMAQDMPMEPYPWDDHILHITEHNNYRKRRDFEQLSERSWQMFDEHVKKHEALLVMEEQKKAIMAMEIQSVLPPQPPGEKPPEEGPVAPPTA